jgi:hypothetical protein
VNPLDDDAIDRALAALPQRDLAPTETRAIFTTAEARLRAKAPVTRWMRAEPAMITVLAFAHLCWAVVRVYVVR